MTQTAFEVIMQGVIRRSTAVVHARENRYDELRDHAVFSSTSCDGRLMERTRRCLGRELTSRSCNRSYKHATVLTEPL